MIVPQTVTLTAYRDGVFRAVFAVQVNGAPIDLNTWTVASFSLRDRPGLTPRLTLTTTPTANGSVIRRLIPLAAGMFEILITNLDLRALPGAGAFAPVRSFCLDLLLTPPGGDTNPYATGPFVLWQAAAFNPVQDEAMVDTVTINITGGQGPAGETDIPVRRVTRAEDAIFDPDSDFQLVIALDAPEALTIPIPAGMAKGKGFEGVDGNGVSDVYPITFVAPAGTTIMGLGSFVLNTPWMAVKFRFDGMNWNPA